MVPAPPKITVVRKKMEASNSNASGLMKPWKNANRWPPAPARPALMVKATVLTPCVLEAYRLRGDRVLAHGYEGAPPRASA